MERRNSQLAQRRSVVFGADQAISSASNFLTAVAVASITDPAGFGAYALGGSLFALALAAGRMTSSERLLLDRDGGRVSLATDSMLLIVALSTAGSILLWIGVGDSAVLAWTAATLPIIAQDRLRFVALTIRPSAAIAGDALWLVVLAAVWPAVWVGGLPSGVGATLITSVPPLASFLLIVVLVRRDVVVKIERDVTRSRSEFRFVLDPWVQAGAVFIAFLIAAAYGSLEIVGRARILVLLFQPFVSISYVGRLVVLRSSNQARIRRWPQFAASACAGYSVLLGALLVVAAQIGIDLREPWSFGPVAFVLMAIAQSARAFQQAVADLLRRSAPGTLVQARVAFAIVLICVVGPLVAWKGLVGLSGAWAVAYIVGAAALRRPDDIPPVEPVER